MLFSHFTLESNKITFFVFSYLGGEGGNEVYIYTKSESLFQKNNVEVPSYDWVEKVNSQKFFQFVMHEDYRKNKFGMSAIVSQFSDPATKSLYSDGAHGALVDA